MAEYPTEPSFPHGHVGLCLALLGAVVCVSWQGLQAALLSLAWEVGNCWPQDNTSTGELLTEQPRALKPVCAQHGQEGPASPAPSLLWNQTEAERLQTLTNTWDFPKGSASVVLPGELGL